MNNNEQVLIYTANKWLSEYLTFYLSRDFNVVTVSQQSEVNHDTIQPDLVIADCEEHDFSQLMFEFSSAHFFLLTPASIETDVSNIVMRYQYPVDPDKLIADVKDYLLNEVRHFKEA